MGASKTERGADESNEGGRMTREEITRMAREAGLSNDFGNLGYPYLPELERFAELVAAAEREACAKVAYDYTVKVSLPNFFESAEYVAAAIRAKGE